MGRPPSRRRKYCPANGYYSYFLLLLSQRESWGLLDHRSNWAPKITRAEVQTGLEDRS